MRKITQKTRVCDRTAGERVRREERFQRLERQRGGGVFSRQMP